MVWQDMDIRGIDAYHLRRVIKIAFFARMFDVDHKSTTLDDTAYVSKYDVPVIRWYIRLNMYGLMMSWLVEPG